MRIIDAFSFVVKYFFRYSLHFYLTHIVTPAVSWNFSLAGIYPCRYIIGMNDLAVTTNQLFTPRSPDTPRLPGLSHPGEGAPITGV